MKKYIIIPLITLSTSLFAVDNDTTAFDSTHSYIFTTATIDGKILEQSSYNDGQFTQIIENNGYHDIRQQILIMTRFDLTTNRRMWYKSININN